MQYRRIHDIEPVDSLPRVPLAQSESPQNPRKRKLDTASHQSWSGQPLSASPGWEKPGTYNEDEIHSFRRVHIKMRKPMDWSKENKHPQIIIDHPGWPSSAVLLTHLENPEDAAAVHCNKPFDGAFCYFEIRIDNSIG